MVNVPCAGGFKWEYQYRNQYGNITPGVWTQDPKFIKRVNWIANCAGVAGFNLIVFDDWRSNDFKIFMEVKLVRVWYQQYGAWYWRSVDLVPPVCYYLGRHGWYWDYDLKTGITPTGSRGTKTLPWPYRESVTTGEYLPLNIYTDEDIVLFHGQPALDNIRSQQNFVAQRKTRRELCLAARYAWTPKTQQRTVINQDTPMEWPGKPIEQMTPPTPDAPPTPAEQTGPGVSVAKLTASYGETPPTRPDGLRLTLEL